MDGRGQCQVFFSLTLYILLSRHSLSMNLKLRYSARWVGCFPRTWIGSQVHTNPGVFVCVFVCFIVSARDLNYGPSVCEASIFPSKQSSQALQDQCFKEKQNNGKLNINYF